MQCHHFQNYTVITCYIYYAFEIEGKVMYPIFVFAKNFSSCSLLSRTAWQACALHTEKSHSHTNSALSRQVYAHVLQVQQL